MFVPPDSNVTACPRKLSELHPFNSANIRRYVEIRARNRRVREPVLFRQSRTLNELELQARWFAGDFGRKFKSTTGDEIEIVQFGTWNRESGPDFRDAAIRLNNRPAIRGCIEIDLIDRSWELHEHATNPAFDGTVLHVFVTKSEREFFSRTATNRNVPQVQIDPAVLPDAFRLEAALAKPGRCCAPLRNLPAERIRNILDAAARFRLQRKAAVLRIKIENSGLDDALFQEIAAALGYKENKLPFTIIAQRLQVDLLRELGEDLEAVLFGVAGFLDSSDLAKFNHSAKDYVRGLWDRWWLHRNELQRMILPSSVWKISSTRPSNHPQRRLAALAALVREWPRLRRSVRAGPTVGPMRKFLGGLNHPFWNSHYTLTAEPMKTEMVLIGESRVTEILANVIFPWWCEPHGHFSTEATIQVWEEYAKQPARLTNRRLETGAVRLFGDDPRRKEFLRTVAHQQGLLQIFEDFCLQDDSDCAHCPFPEQMQKWT